MTAVGANFENFMSQGSVATRCSCGGIFSDSGIANFLQIVSVKEFLKLVNIWWRREPDYSVSFFDSQCSKLFQMMFVMYVYTVVHIIKMLYFL